MEFDRSVFECLALGIRCTREQLALLKVDDPQPVMFSWAAPDPLCAIGNGVYAPLYRYDSSVDEVLPQLLPMPGLILPDPEEEMDYRISEQDFARLPSVLIGYFWPNEMFYADESDLCFRRVWDVWPISDAQYKALEDAVERIWNHPQYERMWAWAEYHANGEGPIEFFGLDDSSIPEEITDPQEKEAYLEHKGQQLLEQLEYEVFEDASLAGPGDLVPRCFEFDLSLLPDDLGDIWDSLCHRAETNLQRISRLFPDETEYSTARERVVSPWV